MSDGAVHVIDDDEAMRDSLRFLLASAGIAVRDYASATDFLQQLTDSEIGCVISDIRMLDVTGIDLLKVLRKERPDIPVILITGHGDIALAVEAMKLGAADFIEKPFEDEVLLLAVEQARGTHEAAARGEAERQEILTRIEQLSSREHDVLLGLVAGKQNKVIAKDLDISPRTVEVYRANLMMKMQAAHLSALVRMALIAGISDRER